MKAIFPLIALSFVGLASAGNLPTNTNGAGLAVIPDNFHEGNHGHYAMMETSSPDPTAAATPTEKQTEHDQLNDDLNEAKKRFDQRQLECDEGLKKIVNEVEVGIKGHDHSKAKKMLDDMKVYKVAAVGSDPCSEKGGVPKSKASGKDIKAAGKNSASSINWSWSFMAVSIVTVFGGR